MSAADVVNFDGEGITHTPNTDRTVAVTTHRFLTSGTLTNLGIEIITGSPSRDCYVVLSRLDSKSVFRGYLAYGYLGGVKTVSGSGGLVISADDKVRVQSWGYVTCTLRLVGTILKDVYSPGGWNGLYEGNLDGPGKVRVFTGSDPAVNTEISETVATGALWELVAVRFDYVSSATAANRVVRLVQDGGVTVAVNPSGRVQTASETVNYNWNVAGVKDTALVGAATNLQCALPAGLVLGAGWTITTQTVARSLGDNIGAPRIFIKDWIDIA